MAANWLETLRSLALTFFLPRPDEEDDNDAGDFDPAASLASLGVAETKRGLDDRDDRPLERDGDRDLDRDEDKGELLRLRERDDLELDRDRLPLLARLLMMLKKTSGNLS